MTNIIGTDQSETLTGQDGSDVIVGLNGDDTIIAGHGGDTVYGDFIGQNLLSGAPGATSFAQYGDTGAWTVFEEPTGHLAMSQTVATQAGAQYEISFDLAANYGAGTVSGAVEILWNGEVVGSFDTNSAVFDAHTISLLGTGGPGTLTFRSIDSSVEPETVIHTDAAVFYYDRDLAVGDETVTVRAIAEGQSFIYQVINGQLYTFDPETEDYTPAGAQASVVVNAIGFNQQDDLIYGIAVENGRDSLGNAVQRADLVALDAAGQSYRIGETPYRSWTADFDENGNLWAFHSSMDRVTMIDVDQRDADGNPRSTTFKFPKKMVTDSVWDVAYNAADQSFYGLVRPNTAGAEGKLFRIDISAVADGGQPVFDTIPLVATDVNGVRVDGVPAITFGAFVVDGDGNMYAGGNGGDHDFDGTTNTSGGIYRVEIDPDGGAARLVLVSDAPKSYSNDGAIDPRAMDPFTVPDRAATVLIRSPEFVETPDPSDSHDDQIETGSGADSADGGFGADTLIGAGAGDSLLGGESDDDLWGGAGPNAVPTGLVSTYDQNGDRFDTFGNPLPEDDDFLSGGTGNGSIHGAAGHDTLYGGAGSDDLYGGSGLDILSGGSEEDHLSGGAQDDALSGGSGQDTLIGGTGADSLFGDGGNDLLNGGSGHDRLDGNDGDDRLHGRNGNDTLSGDAGRDTLSGGSGDDSLSGGADNDVIDGGSGHDTLFAGDGRDAIRTGSGDDSCEGGAGHDSINGHTGNDTLRGGAGNDQIFAGAGADLLDGGLGNDRFVFRAEDLDGSTDVIVNFRRNGAENDRLDLVALDLLAAGHTREDWLTDHVHVTANGDVSVDLVTLTLTITDSFNEDTLLAQVQEALILV